MKLHLFHILVDHKHEAEDVQTRLARGEKFAELARKYSRCSSAKTEGDLGVKDSKRFDPVFAEAAEGLKIDEVSMPVRTRFGYHLIWRKS